MGDNSKLQDHIQLPPYYRFLIFGMLDLLALPDTRTHLENIFNGSLSKCCKLAPYAYTT